MSSRRFLMPLMSSAASEYMRWELLSQPQQINRVFGAVDAADGGME